MTALLLTLCLSWGLCIALMPFARRFATHLGLVDRPDGQRKMQTGAVPLAGGVTILFSACISLAVSLALVDWLPVRNGEGSFLPGLLAAAVVICGVGVLDDRRSLRGRHKVLGQVVAIAIVIGSGVVVQKVRLFGWEFDLGMLGVPFTVFWLLGAINSLNLIDGMDGLLTSVGIIVTLALAGMALLGGHWIPALVAVALAGALLGFLPYNFPPATSFLGDSGSMLIGLVVGVLAIHSALKGPATVALVAPVCMLTIPIFDTGAAIVRRKLTGHSVFMTDRAHLHHCLKRCGLSGRAALLSISLCCLLTGAGALGSVAFHSEALAVVTALAVVSILITTRLFGYTELLLVRQRVLNTMGSFLKRPVNGHTRQQEIRLQGSADWNGLWEQVTWEAFELNLKTVCLDVHIPAVQEAYHARWDRFDDQTEDPELWRVEIPLVVDTHTVGRLSMTGPQDGSAGWRKTAALEKMAVDFLSSVSGAHGGEGQSPQPALVPTAANRN